MIINIQYYYVEIIDASFTPCVVTADGALGKTFG